MSDRKSMPSDAAGEPVSDGLQRGLISPKKKPDGRAGQGERVKQWQWKPGNSGNPSGRPIGSISLTSRIKRKLRKNPHQANAICQSLIDQAIEGDMRAAQILLDRVDGLLVKKVEISDTSHMKRLGFKDPLETVPIDEADEPRTLDMAPSEDDDDVPSE